LKAYVTLMMDVWVSQQRISWVDA